MNDRLLENLARWMISHGTIISDRERSNYYTAVRIIILNWGGNEYTIVQVDGMTCRIDKNQISNRGRAVGSVSCCI